MKKLLVVSLLVVMAGVASAETTVGMFFSDSEFTDATTNTDPTNFVPFEAYLVVVGLDEDVILGYELVVSSTAQVAELSLTGENWPVSALNVADPLPGELVNHLVGFAAPLAVDPAGTVVCTLSFLPFQTVPVEFTISGRATPSVPGHDGPIIASPDASTLVGITTSVGTLSGVVATLNGAGVTAVESSTLSSVKALFD
jgi:hypothetical protein